MRGSMTVGRPVTAAAHPAAAAFPAALSLSAPVTVTADATPHTKGAWVELIAATATEAQFLFVSYNGSQVTGAATEQLLDVGFGAAASEVVKVANIPTGAATAVSATTPSVINARLIPIFVPKGTRVSARVQSVVTVATISVRAGLCASRVNLQSPTACDTYGANTATSRGVNMPTSDTYAEVTATTTQPYQALIVLPLAATLTITAAVVDVTIAIGASGSEVAFGVTQFTSGTNEGAALTVSMPPLFPGHIPAGSRIACKQSTGATTRDVIVIGVPYA